MSLLSTEEAITPLLITILVGALGFVVGKGLLRLALPSTRGARLMMIAACTGHTLAILAIGLRAPNPSFVDRPWAAGICLAIVSSLIAGAGYRAALRQYAPREERAEPIWLPAIVGAIGGFAILGFVALLLTKTSLDGKDGFELTPDEANWRLRVQPWDPSAWGGVAWTALRRQDLDLAEARIEKAESLGLIDYEVLEFRATLAAMRNDCAEARRHFDEAIIARARARLEANLRLELGDYRLAPELTERCEMNLGEPEPE